MEENVLTLDNNIETSKELVTEKEQNNFLETTFGQVINSAIDIGIRALLPNFLEDGIINVKNTLLKQGLAEGIQTVVKEGINLEKSVLGIFTGKFDDVGQMQTAIQKGGIIDSTSDLLDTILSKVQKDNLLPQNVISLNFLTGPVYKNLNLILIFGISILILILANIKMKRNKSTLSRGEY